jgi:exonuclease V gamma subunit
LISVNETILAAENDAQKIKNVYLTHGINAFYVPSGEFFTPQQYQPPEAVTNQIEWKPCENKQRKFEISPSIQGINLEQWFGFELKKNLIPFATAKINVGFNISYALLFIDYLCGDVSIGVENLKIKNNVEVARPRTLSAGQKASLGRNLAR